MLGDFPFSFFFLDFLFLELFFSLVLLAASFLLSQ